DGRAGSGWACSRGGARVGAAAARGAAACGSVSVERADWGAEWAIDSHGKWRAEGAAVHGAGPVGVGLRATTGHESLRAPLAPTRATPARAVAMTLRASRGAARLEATLAGWRYDAAAAGTRAGLEAVWSDAPNRAISVGFEEQHGARRPATATSS